MTQDRNTTLLLRNVLVDSSLGRFALNWLLTDLGFYNEVDLANAEAIALRNYATRLLFQLGINTEKNTLAMTEALAGIPLEMAPKEDVTLSDLHGDNDGNQ